jgi:hypothetical protein
MHFLFLPCSARHIILHLTTLMLYLARGSLRRKWTPGQHSTGRPLTHCVEGKISSQGQPSEGEYPASEFCRHRAKSFSGGPYTSVGIVTKLQAGLSMNCDCIPGRVQKFISSLRVKKGSGANTAS